MEKTLFYPLPLLQHSFEMFVPQSFKLFIYIISHIYQIICCLTLRFGVLWHHILYHMYLFHIIKIIIKIYQYLPVLDQWNSS